MQEFVCAISCVLVPFLLGPVSAIHVHDPFPASLVTVDNWRPLPALVTVVSAALEPGNWTLEEEFKVTPSSTSSGTLRINHPRQPGALCGLGSCATTRLNPLLFTMQIFAASLFLLISALGSSYSNLSVLQLASFTYSLQGLHMLCVGLISEQFTYVITNTIYYVCFNYGAATVYLVSAILAVSIGMNPFKTTTSLISVVLALACMCLHFGHAVFWSKTGLVPAP
ncbi:uncharacterized protein [Dermacentor albipictus]|uniref:uncharacterized protein isoform X2 n=1 Tax=Dermacentor albipictus TaxID=60249 RepID=UPI0031FDCCF3